jgi:hypothetical protein
MGSAGGAYANAMCECFFATLECRGQPTRPSATATLTTLLWFRLMTTFEEVLPLEGGTFRGQVSSDGARSRSIPPLSERRRWH